MEPWQQRVVTEKADLDSKRKLLIEFIQNADGPFSKLDSAEQARLKEQLEAMTWCSVILGSRIEAFK